MKKILLIAAFVIVVITLIGVAGNTRKPTPTVDEILAKEEVEAAPYDFTPEPPKVDSAAIKNLQTYFTVKKDEFDPEATIWFRPKNAPNFVNVNTLYLYFEEKDGFAQNLRLRLQHEDDEWLFIQKCQFLIDGKPYEYYPTNHDTDSGNGGRIWEWLDDSVNASNWNMIYALANAKEAKVKLIGQQYHDIKPVTKKQLLYLKRSLDLFTAKGGKIQ